MPNASAPDLTSWADAQPGTTCLQLTKADLRRPDVDARLRELAPWLEQVHITFEFVPVLPEALRACVNLRALVLTCVRGLAALPAWLAELTRLEKLYLDGSSQNLWSAWPPELAGLQHLRVLSLGGISEGMTSLSPVIGELRALEHLTLTALAPSEQGELPPAVTAVVGRLTNLRCLELLGSISHTFPPELAALPHLHTLRVGWHRGLSRPGQPEAGAQCLPPQLAQCASLRQLRLDGVYDALPDGLFALTHLEHLELQGQFTALPASIGELRNLRTLRIRNQFMTDLSPAIGQLTQLQELQLSGGLAALPAELGQLQQLRVLNLSANYYDFSPEGGFPVVPAVLGKLTQLQELNLAHNNVHALPEELAGLQQLRVLDLGENALTELPPVVLQLRALEHLELNSNQLTELPDALATLPRLRRLKYSNNLLTSLPPTLEARLRRGEIELLANYNMGLISIERKVENQATDDLLTEQRDGEELEEEVLEELAPDLLIRLTAPTEFAEYKAALEELALSSSRGMVYGPLPDDVRRLPDLLCQPLRSPDGDTRQRGIVQLFTLIYDLCHHYNWTELDLYFPFHVPDDVASLLSNLQLSSAMFISDSAWQSMLAAIEYEESSDENQHDFVDEDTSIRYTLSDHEELPPPPVR